MKFSTNLFANPDFDREKFEADLTLKEPRRKLVILFTPRSGSSWLTDMATRSKQLGKPREWFNPNFIPDITRAVNADTLERYINMITRKHASGKVFSCEITIFQLRRVFGGDDRFLHHFPADLPYIWLRRENLVLQAVSLAKAVRTNVFHAPQASADDLSRAEAEFVYQRAEIDRWLGHILDQERLCEAFFEDHGITPLRLSYETMMAQGAEVTLERMLSLVRPRRPHLPEAARKRLNSQHQKIGSERNTEFAMRFASESPARMEEIAVFRSAHPV